MNSVYVVGIGPGGGEQMTGEARKALESCDIIIGYTVYIDLIRGQYPDKTFLTTPMTQEAERCRMAFEEAEQGRDVSLVCSGDAGVYGMAGLMYEIKGAYPHVNI
ncbi:SAM-dependent methyltransferase, partial [[Clostridium] hylemonae]